MILDNYNMLVEWFQLKYPNLVRTMKNSDHHFDESSLNPYHLEGDVFTHTMMVVKQAQLNGANGLVGLAALLHDIGKPIVRDARDGVKVKFYNHDNYSAFMALDIMKEANLSDDQIFAMFIAISLHTMPFKMGIPKLSRMLAGYEDAVDILNPLFIADQTGRFFLGEDKEFPPVEKLDHHPFPNYGKSVSLMCGLPCSGKSTYVKRVLCSHAESEGAVIISRDDIVLEMGGGLKYNEAFKAVNHDEVNKELDNRLKEASKGDKNVIVDMCHMSKKSRNKTLNYFNRGWSKGCFVVLRGMESTMRLNDARASEGKYIQSQVYDKMIFGFQIPTYNEFDSIFWSFNE